MQAIFKYDCNEATAPNDWLSTHQTQHETDKVTEMRIIDKGMTCRCLRLG